MPLISPEILSFSFLINAIASKELVGIADLIFDFVTSLFMPVKFRLIEPEK
jgi:hypothetical protein